MPNQLDDDANRVMNEGRGLCRVLAVGVLLVAATVAGCVFTGCALLDSIDEADIEKLDALAEKWKDKLEQSKPGTPPETPPTKPEPDKPIVGDAVAFSSLQWQYGGMKAGSAVLSTPRLSSLSCNGRSVFYRWEVGMGGWGLGHDDAGAVCAVFFEKDGQWVGGKFDWVSTSRSSRELKHVESYGNWPSSGIKLPWRGKVAFVVVSADGKRRSNVLVAEAR